jgi:hypothetical protein
MESMMTHTSLLTLDEQRAEFARGRFLAMPIAGTIAWSVVGVCGAFLPIGLAAWVLFIGTGSIFGMALLIARLLGEDLVGKTRPGNAFDALFMHTMVMSWLVFAIAIPFFQVELTSLPLTVGILLGLMWVPFSWIIQHGVGLFHAFTRTPMVLGAWYLFPEDRFVAVPAVIVAVYLATIYVLERRRRQ